MVQDQATSTQFAEGLNNGNTAVTHLFLRGGMTYAAKAKRTFVCLFGDIKTAFASFCRAVVHLPGSTGFLANRMANAGISKTNIQNLQNDVISYTAWEMSEKNGHLKRMLLDSMRGSWTSFEYMKTVMVAKKAHKLELVG